MILNQYDTLALLICRLAKLSEEGPGMNNIQMTDCPAYVHVRNDREHKRTVEHHYEEVDLRAKKN